MEEEKKNNGHGGKREGAGRKKLDKTADRRPTMSIAGSKTELDRIREKAESLGIPISRYVIESLKCADSQN